MLFPLEIHSEGGSHPSPVFTSGDGQKSLPLNVLLWIPSSSYMDINCGLGFTLIQYDQYKDTISKDRQILRFQKDMSFKGKVLQSPRAANVSSSLVLPNECLKPTTHAYLSFPFGPEIQQKISQA